MPSFKTITIDGFVFAMIICLSRPENIKNIYFVVIYLQTVAVPVGMIMKKRRFVFFFFF